MKPAEGADRAATVARLSAFGAADDGDIDLAEAALLLGSFERPEADLDAPRHWLGEAVRDLAGESERAGPERSASLAGRSAMLASVLAGRHELTGDRETYDDLANANLISVIERRRGLPVSLSIIYIHVARALGWPVEGLNFPGRFLVRLGAADGRAVLDPFDDGRVRDAVALRELLKTGAGASAELAPEHFMPAGNRDILLRLQNNIKVRLIQSDQLEAAAGAIERMLLIAPKEPLLWLEAGGHYGRLGNLRAAIEAAERSRVLAADERLRQRAESLLQDLKGKMN
jgi:regulator of sirC expression with transglutaminase-like and TPR domain